MNELTIDNEWVDIRCNKDNSLMARVTADTVGHIECKCKKCRQIVKISLPIKI